MRLLRKLDLGPEHALKAGPVKAMGRAQAMAGVKVTAPVLATATGQWVPAPATAAAVPA